MGNLQAALDAPTALNVTVQATRRREVRRSSRPKADMVDVGKRHNPDEANFVTAPALRRLERCRLGSSAVGAAAVRDLRLNNRFGDAGAAAGAHREREGRQYRKSLHSSLPSSAH